jgi:hypothetical protein
MQSPSSTLYVIGDVTFVARVRAAVDFSVEEVGSLSDLMRFPQHSQGDRVGFLLDVNSTASVCNDIRSIRQNYPTSFICVLDSALCDQPFKRIKLFDAGVSQVAYNIESALTPLTQNLTIMEDHRTFPRYICPFCGLSHLTEDELWRQVV